MSHIILNSGDAQKKLAAALGRIPSGLFILTARQGEAETGMLASWVQQCSFDPPQITVALQPTRDIAKWLTPGAAFTLNILDEAQTDMLIHFGRGFKVDEPAFAGIDVEQRGQAGPILREALAFLKCTVSARFSAGDHDLIIGKVERGDMLNDGHPMVHVRKSGMHY